MRPTRTPGAASPRRGGLRCTLLAVAALAGGLPACGDNLVAAGRDAGPADAAGPTLTVALPQLVGGAASVNPAVYQTVPLRLAVGGGRAASVAVVFGNDLVAARDDDGDGVWEAPLAVGDLDEGEVYLSVTALPDGPGVPATASGTLLVRRDGVQLTRWEDDGSAGTPRLHRRGDALWLTWTDRREGRARAWLAPLDGAGRFLADPAPLVAGTEDVLHARTAVGATSVAVLYQEPGQPYATHLRVLDQWGVERLAPQALDPEGASGTFGGAITYDGAAFVAVWRVSRGAGTGEVRWLRLDEATLEVTGPVVVAAAGDGTVDGDFEPFSFVSVAATPAGSLVGFVRNRYSAMLDIEVPRAQYAQVAPDGTVVATSYATSPDDFFFAREARVFRDGDGLVALWSAFDLLAPEDNPPNLFYAARADAAGTLDPERGTGTRMFVAPNDRDEPYLLVGAGDPAAALGILGWMDHRAYEDDPLGGYITLYAAPVAPDLTVPTAPTVFAHARAFAGLTDLDAAPAGPNALFVWADNRYSQGIMDPRPVLFLETAWY